MTDFVSVFARDEAQQPLADTLALSLPKMLELLELEHVELAVVLTDDVEVQALNKTYRDKDSPTDVLSFSQIEDGEGPLPPGAPRPLGDVIISLDTARRQVADGCLPRLWSVFGRDDQAPEWSLERELLFLTVHGVLHLIGHDHMEPVEREAMETEESRLLQELV